MISKELEKKVDKTVAGTIATEAVFGGQDPDQNQAPSLIADESPIDQPDFLEEQPIENTDEPLQVAGLGGIGKFLSEKTLQAEKRAGRDLPDRAVQEVGGRLVIREDPEMIAGLNEALGGDYVKGINYPEIKGIGGIDTVYEVPSYEEYMQTLRNINQDLFEYQRRGTLNMDAILALAKNKNMDQLVHDWATRAPGESANAEELVAGIVALDGVMQETSASIVKYISTPTEELRNRSLQLLRLEAQIAASVSGAGSEAGRALYALRTLNKAGFPDAASRADQLFGLENAQDIDHMLRMYMVLDNPNKRIQMAKGGLISRGMDAVMEIWINSLLSSPVTHAVNIAGNTMFRYQQVLETGMAAAISAGRRGLGIGKAEKVRAREMIAQLEGIRAGFFDAILIAGKTGITEEAGDFASKIDTRRRRAIGTTGDLRVIGEEIRKGNLMAASVNIFGVSQRLASRALLMEDEYFKVTGARMKLHQLVEMQAGDAYDQAIQAGKTAAEAREISGQRRVELLNNPPPQMVADTKEAARVMTFQNDLDALSSAQHLMSHPLIKLFVPFFRTPVNIMTAVFERTPLAVAHPKIREAIMAGGRDADIALGKIATGSAIMGAMTYLSSGLYDTDENQDVIVMGAGPTSPEGRRSLANQSIQPYSINIRKGSELAKAMGIEGEEDGTYRSITYSRFDPVSGLLAMAADFAYYSQYEEDADTLGGVAQAFTLAISEYAMTQPMLQGVEELSLALTQRDPKLKADLLLELFSEKIASAAISTVPVVGGSSFMAGVERAGDPTQRAVGLPEGQVPFTDMDVTDAPAWMRGAYIALEKAKSRNPFFSKDLPPAVNEWNEVLEAGTGASWEFWSPVRIKDTKYSGIDAEFMRLGSSVGRTPKKISGVRLTRDQRLKYIELTNTLDSFGRFPDDPNYDAFSTLKDRLESRIYQEEYLGIQDDEDKLNDLKAIVASQRSVARQQLYMIYPELKAKIDAAK